jgi:hypothetical protein
MPNEPLRHPSLRSRDCKSRSQSARLRACNRSLPSASVRIQIYAFSRAAFGAFETAGAQGRNWSGRFRKLDHQLLCNSFFRSKALKCIKCSDYWYQATTVTSSVKDAVYLLCAQLEMSSRTNHGDFYRINACAFFGRLANAAALTIRSEEAISNACEKPAAPWNP